MQFAIVGTESVAAYPGAKGICRNCNKPVIAKCGEIKIWHWAHAKENNCDNWYENESQWHRDWKIPFGKENTEISIVKNGIRHIADIYTKNQVVIELQNSAINVQTIVERENFYGERMMWLLNGKNFNINIQEYIVDDQVELMKWDNQTLGMPIWRTTFSRHLFTSEVCSLLKEWGFYKHPTGDFFYAHSYGNGTNLAFHKSKLERLSILIKLPAYLKSAKMIDEDFLYDYHCSYPPKSWEKSYRPIFIDIKPDYLFMIKGKFGVKRGKGYYVSKSKFLAKYGGAINQISPNI